MPYFALIAILLCTLYLWSRDREKEHQRKIDNCIHPPDMQQTLRVNNILTMNAALMHRVIPGRRWVKKHCRACGWQRHLYGNSRQKWADFKREWEQETIDRIAEYKAREAAHERDKVKNG